MGNATNVLGTAISIGTTAVDPATDSYTAIRGITNYDGPGGAANTIDTSTLDSTAREFRKGLKDQGEMTFTLNRDFADAGQTALASAQNDDDLYNFKVVFPDGTTLYQKGLVMQFRISGGGVDDVLKGSVTIKCSGDATYA